MFKYVPALSWTVAKEGSKNVPISEFADNRQITVVFVATMEGDFHPPQLIY